jgi:hypothetical protein
MKKIMRLIRLALLISAFTVTLFLCVDFFVTQINGSRGFSQFFETDGIEGRKNKNNFTGVFGSPLDSFRGIVSIGPNGERVSLTNGCESSSNVTLFIGDSITAGFEVNDDKTFVSQLNADCKLTGRLGLNFGVRAHDTHSVIGTYLRIYKNITHTQVVYLVNENDFFENVDPNVYSMMTRRFGRRYEGAVVSPSDDYLFSVIASVRQFMGDNFSLSTYAIVRITNFLSFATGSPSVNQVNKRSFYEKDTAVSDFEAVEKMGRLIIDLYNLVSDQNAKLFVIPSPCLRDDCGYRNDLFEQLNEALRNSHSQITYVNIDSKVKTLLARDDRTPSDMHFRNDGHFSEYGHRVMSEIFKQTIN